MKSIKEPILNPKKKSYSNFGSVKEDDEESIERSSSSFSSSSVRNKKDYYYTQLGNLKEYIANKLRFKHQLLREFLAEFFGTFVFISFSSASVAQYIFSGKKEFLSVNISFGFSLAIAIIAVGKVSGGHMNPAVSLSMLLLGRLTLVRFFIYASAQVLGAFFASLMVYLVYLNQLGLYKLQYSYIYDSRGFIYSSANLTRFADLSDLAGNPAFSNSTIVPNLSNFPNQFVQYTNGKYSIDTAGIFGTYPKDVDNSLATFSNFFDQFFSTALFIISILAITDKKNNTEIPHQTVAILIGLSLIVVGTAFGYNGGFAVNPARDFGPRMFTLVAGWGTKTFSAGNYYFWIPIIGPMLGSVFGTFLYWIFISNHWLEETN